MNGEAETLDDLRMQDQTYRAGAMHRLQILAEELRKLAHELGAPKLWQAYDLLEEAAWDMEDEQ